MSIPFPRVGVTIKSELSHRDEAVHGILQLVEKAGSTICLDAKRCADMADAAGHALFEREEDIDLLIVIGGDGTILRSVRELRDFQIPLLTINMGVVGYLAEMTLDEVPRLLPSFLRGEAVIDERSLLSVRALRGADDIFKGFVLNEAVISQGSIARLVDLRTSINGEELTIFHADGLIVSTPTGSSAYSLAAGGPVVHPRLPATILTPINPHSFSQKPIVIPSDHTIEVEVMTKENKFRDIEVSLTLDGQTYVKLERGDRVLSAMNGKTVKFLRRKADPFYATLRNKLKWGERVE